MGFASKLRVERKSGVLHVSQDFKGSVLWHVMCARKLQFSLTLELFIYSRNFYRLPNDNCKIFFMKYNLQDDHSILLSAPLHVYLVILV